MNNVEERPSRSTACSSRASAEAIEAEAIDMHFKHPVPQAVHDQLEYTGMAHIECVAAAGIVAVITRVVGVQPVVSGVVDAAET